MNIVFRVSALLAGLFLPLDQPLTVTAPATIVEWHGGQLKGTPSQLAWSPDSKLLCLQTTEGDTPGKTHPYVITLESRKYQGVDVPPDWVAKYWEWKSARTPPGRPELVIQVETKNESAKVPTQSLMDKSKQGMIDNAVGAQNEAGGSVTRTLTLKGEAIGRYVNEPLVPGLTFGWSPAALHAVAYTKTDGRLAIFDFDKIPVDVEGTRAVLLPAWSPDGSSIALLQKTGRRDYVLSIVGVTHP